jgi:glycosyltransferase involved in cell wall biosynthesis
MKGSILMDNNNKINVLQLVEGFGWGGAEKKLFELVKCMNREKFHTTICSLGMNDNLQHEAESLGVDIVTIVRKKRIDLSLIPKVAHLMNERQIDVVMTTLFYADVLGPIAGKFSRVKAVFSWETISAPEWLYKRRLWPYRFAIRYCDRVIAVSEATARFLKEKRGVPADKVLVIPYGVNLEKFNLNTKNEIRKEFGLNAKDCVIGVVGRLHPQKGHVYLIDAAVQIVKEFPDTKFVFAGDGDLRHELEERIKARQLEKHFLFVGYRMDIANVMSSFDIFVLPSLYEGLPNVVLEAMASGKPVVATSVDGTVEAVVDGETGYLVQPTDVEALQKALLRLLGDRELARKMGKKGRERVEQIFSLEKQVRSFEELYQSYVM